MNIKGREIKLSQVIALAFYYGLTRWLPNNDTPLIGRWGGGLEPGTVDSFSRRWLLLHECGEVRTLLLEMKLRLDINQVLASIALCLMI